MRNDEIIASEIYLSMLCLSRAPLPQIGSPAISNESLLTLELAQLENECIPPNISSNTIYSTLDTYLLDLLHCHDSRLHNQQYNTQ